MFSHVLCLSLRIIILLGGGGGGRALSKINKYHFIFSLRFFENKLLVRRGGGGGGVFIKNKKLPLIFMFCEGK